MRSLIVIVLAFLLVGNLNAQVNVGGTTPPKSGAALEVTSGGNKGFLGPKVALTGINTWAPLADTAIEGMIVFNLGTNASFPTKGYYYWLNGKWTSFASSGGSGGSDGGGSGGGDQIRAVLTTSQAAYDAAAINDWVKITETEFNSISNISGALQMGAPKAVSTGAAGEWNNIYGPCAANSVNGYSIGTTESPQQNAYCVAVAFNTSAGGNAVAGTVTEARVMVGSVTNSGSLDGMVTYGNPITSSFAVVLGTRTCFVCKKPNTKTPSNTTSPSTAGGSLGFFIKSSSDMRPFSWYQKTGYRIFRACAYPTNPSQDNDNNRAVSMTGIAFSTAQW